MGYHNDVNIYPNDANNEIISGAWEASSHYAGVTPVPGGNTQHSHWRGEELGIAVTCEPGPIITQHIASPEDSYQPSPVSCFRMRRVNATPLVMMLQCNAFSEPLGPMLEGGDKHRCCCWPRDHWHHEEWGMLWGSGRWLALSECLMPSRVTASLM